MRRSATDNNGVIDHIAILATDPEGFGSGFDAIGVAARKRCFMGFQLFQMLVKDPDGLTIEPSFHGIATVPAWGAGSENNANRPRLAEAGGQLGQLATWEGAGVLTSLP